MRKLLVAVVISLGALLMSGCSYERIPPAHQERF